MSNEGREPMKHISFTDNSIRVRREAYYTSPGLRAWNLYYGKEAPVADSVKRPWHYTDRVPGVECIEVSQHFNFNLGNVIKYVWRSGSKGDAVEDLRKAIQYLEFEIARIEDARPKADGGWEEVGFGARFDSDEDEAPAEPHRYFNEYCHESCCN